MVKRMCILFPDQSLEIVSPEDGEAAAHNRARVACQAFNKHNRKGDPVAMFGEIEVDLMSFREKF